MFVSRSGLWIGLIVGSVLGLPALFAFVSYFVIPSCIGLDVLALGAGSVATSGLWIARTRAYRLVQGRFTE